MQTESSNPRASRTLKILKKLDQLPPKHEVKVLELLELYVKEEDVIAGEALGTELKGNDGDDDDDDDDDSGNGVGAIPPVIAWLRTRYRIQPD